MKDVVIADEHYIIREALKRVLSNFNIVGEAVDGDSAIELVRQKKPDMILLDLSMPKRSGKSLIREIRSCHEDIKILVVTLNTSKKSVSEALDTGANGYFLKDENVSALRSAIACIRNGGTYVSPGVGRSDCREEEP